MDRYTLLLPRTPHQTASSRLENLFFLFKGNIPEFFFRDVFLWIHEEDRNGKLLREAECLNYLD